MLPFCTANCRCTSRANRGVTAGQDRHGRKRARLALPCQPGPLTVKNWSSRIGLRSPYPGDRLLRFTVRHDRCIMFWPRGVAGLTRPGPTGSNMSDRRVKQLACRSRPGAKFLSKFTQLAAKSAACAADSCRDASAVAPLLLVRFASRAATNRRNLPANRLAIRLLAAGWW